MGERRGKLYGIMVVYVRLVSIMVNLISVSGNDER